MARSVSLTQDFGLGPNLTELIFHPEAWEGGRRWCPRNNEAVGSDFCHWLRSIHQWRRRRRLSFRCLHWKQGGRHISVVCVVCVWELLGEKNCSSSVLTGTMGGCEIEACDLTSSVGQDADQLTLIGDGWTQTTDGVGVQVAGDRHLCPWRACVFLPELVKKKRWRVNKLLKKMKPHSSREWMSLSSFFTSFHFLWISPG